MTIRFEGQMEDNYILDDRELWEGSRGNRATPGMDDLIKTIEVLKVQKGDAIILKCDKILSMQARENIQNSFKRVLKKMGKRNISIVILEDSLEIENCD